MLRRIILLLFIVSIVLLSGCTEKPTESVDDVKARFASYEDRISALDPDLRVYKSEHECENDYIVHYSVEVKNGACYGMKFVYYTSSGREEIKVEFGEACMFWNEQNVNFFATMIVEFSHTNNDISLVKEICYAMATQETYHVDWNVYFCWDGDEKDAALCYIECI